jgi:prolyl 4-hydroxylase
MIFREIPNFLTPEECKKLIDISSNNLTVSTVVNTGQISTDISHRSSEQCWHQDCDDLLVECISRRVALITNTDMALQEQLQVVRYKIGGFFNGHYDSSSGLNRYLTFLIYLNDDFTGGETVFSKLGKSVKPEQGKAILFQNLDEKCQIIPESFHCANEIQPLKNESEDSNENTVNKKWIATKWIHFK